MAEKATVNKWNIKMAAQRGKERSAQRKCLYPEVSGTGRWEQHNILSYRRAIGHPYGHYARRRAVKTHFFMVLL